MSRTVKQFEYVRRFYGVPAKRGMRVQVYGQMGTITADDGSYIRVRMDGQRHSGNYHPTDGVVYYDEFGGVLVDTRAKGDG